MFTVVNMMFNFLNKSFISYQYIYIYISRCLLIRFPNYIQHGKKINPYWDYIKYGYKNQIITRMSFFMKRYIDNILFGCLLSFIIIFFFLWFFCFFHFDFNISFQHCVIESYFSFGNCDSFYNIPWCMFVSLQPVRDTREKQVQLWKDLILDYCKTQKIFVIGLEEDFALFSNPVIESKSFVFVSF